ncbi:MAG: carbohydrate ABC transporter permease [Actinomycetes bacterium]
MGQVLSDAAPKLAQMVAAIAVFFGILLLIFFAAARAKGRLQRPLVAVVFLGPAVLLLLFGLIIPAIRTFLQSLQSADGSHYIGVANYKWAFTSSDQQRVLLNTVLWIIVAPLFATGFGLALAVLTDKIKRESLAKSLIFMPMAISFVGASIIWKFVYDWKTPTQPQTGLLSQVVMWLGWDNPPNWLLWQPWNNFLLMIIMIWVETGFAMVVLSAAIKAIPADVNEAASLDGATGWRLFTKVTVPMIRGTIVVVLTTIMVAVLKVFDIVRTMTGGNFGTQVLSNEMYSQSFVQADPGRGSALAVILFLGVIPLIVYNIRILRKERQVR